MKGRVNPILLVMVVWICSLGIHAYWIEKDNRRQERQLARTIANAFFQQILVSRQWNADHGGVYVPVTNETQPNLYLPEHFRELTTDNGIKLTKINPTYMTRQMAELAAKKPGAIRFHTTSLNPIRPENQAADWEEKWLRSFEEGAKEQGEFFEDGNTTWFRYMAPLLTEPECLKCHAQQGYKLGDIRGGISVSLPYATHTHPPLLAGYGSVAVIGLIFIFGFGIAFERKRRLFKATFNNPTPTCLTDTDYTILMANEAYWAEFGPLPDKQKSIKCYEHRPGKTCHTALCPLTQIMSGADQYYCEPSKEKAGETQHFIVTAKPLLDSKGKVVGIVESFQEITVRKKAEKALEKSNRLLEAMSITDGLTGIANRRRFDEALVREHARHARSGAELSMIMLDLDHFKSFNDCYGHVKGDECLRQIAQVIAACASRPADLAARYGGEEFACILPETDSSGAVAIAEEIRRGIMALAIPHRGSGGADHVTASLGVVTLRCTPEGSPVEIIALADEQLYLAKAAGRNRVKFVATHRAGDKTQNNLVQLAWKDSFCCGNQLIDSQHQALFHTANELLEAVLKSLPAPEISALITQLLDEVTQHFHDEEKILATVAFPGLSQHVEEHTKLLAKGQELPEGFQESTITVGDVFQFLAAEVIMLHMLEADREYFPFINQTGAAAPEAGKDDLNRAPVTLTS